MTGWWSPHPRYRLYTTGFHYAPGASRQRGAIERLESEICRRFGVAGAVCVPMARTGLLLTFLETIKPGQKVIMSPLTIIDVVNAVLLAGGKPVFADICRATCGLDPDEAESLIDGQTGAVLLTHLHGCTAGARTFAQMCSRRKIPLIEDAAQAFGAVEDGQALGSIGHTGVYSFGFFKNFSTWQGGMVVSRDRQFIERVRARTRQLPEMPRARLVSIGLAGLAVDAASWPPLFSSLVFPIVRRNFGWVRRRLDPEAGATRLGEFPASYMLRMRDAQARIGLHHLERVDADNRARCDAARLYHEGLRDYPEILTPHYSDGSSNIYTYFPIQIRKREELLSFARAQGRDFAAQHLRNCANLPEFHELRRKCPEAQAVSEELILLPTYPRYPQREVLRNIEVIVEFIRRQRLTATPSNGVAAPAPESSRRSVKFGR